MQFAVTVSPDGTQVIQAGKDAPRYAQCVYCGMPMELKSLPHGYEYEHTSILSADTCPHLQEMSRQADEAFENWRQEGLDRVLDVI